MSPLRRTLLVSLVLLLIGGAFGGGWWLGDRQGRRSGFQTGKRYGEVQAAKIAPTPVSDRGHAAEVLRLAPAFAGLPVADEEWQGFAALVNQAVSPCHVAARKGASLATSALEPAQACAGLETQAALALAAYRTFVGGAAHATGADAGADGVATGGGGADGVATGGGGADGVATGGGGAGADAMAEALAVLRIERRLPVPRGDADGLVRGNPDAAVTLTVFTDYQCPYCARGEALVDGILAARGQDLRVVTRHLPLTRIHPAALPAAVAVEAARLQGKGMELHAALFALGGRALGELAAAMPEGSLESPFVPQARALGLDLERFARDVDDPDTEARVRADMDLAEQLGVRGTPAFFFDGREAVEGRSPEAFAALLDKAQAERAWRFSWGLAPPPTGVAAP